MARHLRRAVVRPRHASRPLRYRILVLTAASTAAVVGFLGVYAATSLVLFRSAIETHDLTPLLSNSDAEKDQAPADFAAGTPINIALIGTDERDGNNAEIGGYVSGMRGDTTMVMHISADRSRIEVVSIPRDSRVRISDCSMYDGSVVRGWTGKFNIALANGGKNGNRGEGAACVMRTITDLTGVEFSGHFVMVDFTGFEKMIDALDGVPMCIPQPMRAPKANLDLEAGPQVLDGANALAFARARTGSGVGDGTDLMRIDRQQELMTNVARKALGMNLLTDTGELTSFMRAGAESLTMSEKLGDLNNLIGLAYSLRDFDTRNLVFETVPWRYAGDGSGDVLWDEPAASEMWQRLANDESIVVPEPTPAPTPSVTAGPTPQPTASATPSVVSPSPSEPSGPVRETQQDILDSCVIG